MRSVALVVCFAVVSTTACGPSWPKPNAVSSHQLAAAPIQTIDILPLDLELWTHAGYGRDADAVRLDAEAKIVGATSEAMYQRGYSVGAVMDWNGNYVGPDGQTTTAIDPPELAATLDSLASYGTAVSSSLHGQKPVALPFPYLPTRLGTRTGADATLYIGGWSFVGKEPDHAGTVAKVVVGVVLIVGIIAILAVASKSKPDVPDFIGGAGKAMAHAATSVGRTALRAAMRAGNLTIHVGRAAGQLAGDVVQVLDAFGHTQTHIQMVSGRPEWSNDDTLPHSGRPRMYLEMTLVDNRTGEVLWHAQERFPANAARPTDVSRVARTLLATLPRR